jgi:lipopolysaccharide heptosyltransferase II
MREKPAWEQAKRVLCVRLDALGNVLMTTPALRALKEASPNRRLTLLTSPAGAEAGRLVPEIDEIIVYEAPWVKATPLRDDSCREFAIADLLKDQAYDAAIIFTVYTQDPLPAAFLCYLADIPLRLAYCHENPYQLLTHWIPDPEPQQRLRHEVQRQLDLGAAVGARAGRPGLSLRVSDTAFQRVRRLLDHAGLDGRRPVTVVHPGASAPARRYPPESFARAAALLAHQTDTQIVFTGTRQEIELISGIQSLMEAPSTSLAGRLDLEGLAALLSLSSLLVVNNTGPAHVAAAVGTPVVVLYALTNPQHTPWGVPSRVLYHDVPCRFCNKSVCPQGHHQCLRSVAPEAVAAAARELLLETRFARAARSLDGRHTEDVIGSPFF